MQSMLERRSKKTILQVQMILFPYQELLVYHPIDCVFLRFHNLLEKELYYYKCLSQICLFQVRNSYLAVVNNNCYFITIILTKNDQWYQQYYVENQIYYCCDKDFMLSIFLSFFMIFTISKSFMPVDKGKGEM